MALDILVKNGLIIDGTGSAGFHADVGIEDGKIVSIEPSSTSNAKKTIDAEGHVVAPGFIDGHTHMDAQVFWDELGSCSCYHGVTSVVMGNCGFTLAPCRPSEADFVFRNLERAEDISRSAMKAGIDWDWETYPQYMDSVDRAPKGINYAGYIGHSALRTYVMGERAFEEEANDDELKTMAHIVRDAVKAGAMGFTTSRTRNHETADRRPVSSRAASWDEVRYIASEMRRTGAGIFEIAGEDTGRDPEKLADYENRLRDLAINHQVPVTFGMFSSRHAPEFWRRRLNFVHEVNRDGGNIFVQVHSRALNVILSFETRTPFDNWDVWREVRQLPKQEQLRQLANPEIKAKLVKVASKPSERHRAIGAEVRPPDWHWTYLLDDPAGGSQRMDELAAQRGVSPVELMIDLAVESAFKVKFRQPIANEIDDEVISLLKTPDTVCTFSDSGAHVSQIMDSSLQTHLFAHWVREKQEIQLEQAVQMVTVVPASKWGFKDRGRIQTGLAADLTIFDPDTIGPNMPEVVNDLPSGARRLKQTAHGIKNTIVNGEVFLEENEHTGSQSGRLLRGPLTQ